MSALHLNTLTLAELSGARKIERSDQVSLKYLDKKTFKFVKTPVYHYWKPKVYHTIVQFLKWQQEGKSTGQWEEPDPEENLDDDFLGKL